jgi:hypothetical protein
MHEEESGAAAGQAKKLPLSPMGGVDLVINQEYGIGQVEPQ